MKKAPGLDLELFLCAAIRITVDTIDLYLAIEQAPACSEIKYRTPVL